MGCLLIAEVGHLVVDGGLHELFRLHVLLNGGKLLKSVTISLQVGKLLKAISLEHLVLIQHLVQVEVRVGDVLTHQPALCSQEVGE